MKILREKGALGFCITVGELGWIMGLRYLVRESALDFDVLGPGPLAAYFMQVP